MQIFQGVLGMVVGILIIVFRPRIKDITGNIGFAERYLGLGGTWTFLLILGLGLFAISLMWATGSLQDVFMKFFGGIMG